MKVKWRSYRPFLFLFIFVIIFAKALVVAIELCCRSSCDSPFARFALCVRFGNVVALLLLRLSISLALQKAEFSYKCLRIVRGCARKVWPLRGSWKREIKERDDPETVKKYAEARVIKDDGGKMIFAQEIVPTLEEIHFEPFKSLFDEKLETL